MHDVVRQHDLNVGKRLLKQRLRFDRSQSQGGKLRSRTTFLTYKGEQHGIVGHGEWARNGGTGTRALGSPPSPSPESVVAAARPAGAP